MTDVLKLFQFIKDKEGYEIPLKQKLIYGYPFTEEDLNVKDSLDLSYTKITSLPDGLKVGGNLNLTDCTSLKYLPDGLTVKGDLYLGGTQIAKRYNEKVIRKLCDIRGKIFLKYY